MAETKKTEAAAAAAPPEAACLTLRQKLVEMRKACPEIVKKQHSDGVSYKYAKIYDVWEKITPIMNELGVDFDVISEQATRHAENGDPVYWAEAGRMLGASDGESDYELLSGGSGTAVVYDLSGLSFSPQIKIEGDTDEDALIRKLRDLEPEFIDFILEALNRREGGAYVTADSRLY